MADRSSGPGAQAGTGPSERRGSLSKISSVLPAAALVVAAVLVLGIAVLTRPARAADFTIPEAKLLDGEFASAAWGPATVTRTDAAGSAVRFDFTGLAGDSTGVKDDYSVDTVYGQVLPSHANGNFSIFDGYALTVQNLDDAAVHVSLFVNTGFTGVSGVPSEDERNDTFWHSAWTEIAAGETVTLRLDFGGAVPWHIEDNPEPHTQGSEGVATAINATDRAELSAIGFQVYASAGNAEASLLVAPVPEPATMGVVGLGVAGLVWRRRRR